MYFTFCASEKEARAEVERYISTRRVDWDFEVVEVPNVSPYLLAPCHRRTPQEAARWAAVDGDTPPLQYGGGKLAGVVVRGEKPFSRNGEDWRGWSSVVRGFAWVVS